MKRIVLIVSLVANALLVSLVAVGATRLIAARRSGHDHFFQRLAERMPPDDGAILMGAVEERRAEVRRARIAYETAASRAESVVQASPLDPQALGQALDNVKATRVDLLDQRLRIFAEVVPKMSPAGREALLKMGD